MTPDSSEESKRRVRKALKDEMVMWGPETPSHGNTATGKTHALPFSFPPSLLSSLPFFFPPSLPSLIPLSLPPSSFPPFLPLYLPPSFLPSFCSFSISLLFLSHFVFVKYFKHTEKRRKPIMITHLLFAHPLDLTTVNILLYLLHIFLIPAFSRVNNIH